MSIIHYRRPNFSRWSSLDQLTSLHDEMNRLFENSLGKGSQDLFGGWAPAMDVVQEKDQINVSVELPGLKKEDIDISLQENLLTIGGERKTENENAGAESFRTERYVGRFQRTVSLPTAVNPEKVEATYRDGVLTVSLAKAEEAKPKQITVNVS